MRIQVKLAVMVGLLGLLAACGSAGDLKHTVKRGAFTSAEFGVSVSPRVTSNPNPPKGGGRYSSTKPYSVRGVTYTPLTAPQGYVATGHASWYGSDFHGRRTANGEIFSANAITGAHPTLPLPCYVRVTNLDNGRSLLVRINDRGPYMADRLIDLSARTANVLGLIGQGTGQVQVQFVSMAPLSGDDSKMLAASLNKRTRIEQGGDVRYAMADEPSNLLDGITSMFGYADAGDASVVATPAEAAINAMALGVDQGEAIDLVLGAFPKTQALELAAEFALLAAVDEAPVVLPGGAQATRLTLLRLKPGAGLGDVLALADGLGLGNLISQ